MSLSVGKQGSELLSWLHLPLVSEAWLNVSRTNTEFFHGLSEVWVWKDSVRCPLEPGSWLMMPRSDAQSKRGWRHGPAVLCWCDRPPRGHHAVRREQAVHGASSRVFKLPKTGHQLTLGDGKRTQAQTGFPLSAACCHEEQAALVALAHYLNLFF